MKISELSQKTGISIPTLKFYLREGILKPGQLSSPNQADYSELHVRRAALVGALREVAGLSISKIATIVEALDHGENTYELMGTAVDALGGETISEFTPEQVHAAAEIDRFLETLGLPVREDSLARHQLIAAFASIRTMLFPGTPVELLTPYAEAAEQIARMEIESLPGMMELEPELALEKAMLGLALFEPVFVAFRRLSHERIAAEHLGPPKT
ncbi:MAG: MerR family transcriptional regulator [bacterium]